MEQKQPYILENGDRYEGALLNKQKHGYGVYTYANGDTYTGDWLNDNQYGYGIYLFANGSRYEGEFVNGQFEGEGTLHNQTNEDDDIIEYIGQWKGSMPHGKGKATYKNGDKYDGTF